MSMTLGDLLKLALGDEGYRHCDTAIPQGVFDRMTQAERDNRAGWYYPTEGPGRTMGRLLTKTECWAKVVARVKAGEIIASLMTDRHAEPSYATYISLMLAEWPCFSSHAERGEIILKAAQENA